MEASPRPWHETFGSEGVWVRPLWTTLHESCYGREGIPEDVLDLFPRGADNDTPLRHLFERACMSVTRLEVHDHLLPDPCLRYLLPGQIASQLWSPTPLILPSYASRPRVQAFERGQARYKRNIRETRMGQSPDREGASERALPPSTNFRNSETGELTRLLGEAPLDRRRLLVHDPD